MVRWLCRAFLQSDSACGVDRTRNKGMRKSGHLEVDTLTAGLQLDLSTSCLSPDHRSLTEWQRVQGGTSGASRYRVRPRAEGAMNWNHWLLFPEGIVAPESLGIIYLGP